MTNNNETFLASVEKMFDEAADLVGLSEDLRHKIKVANSCLLYTSPSPRDKRQSRMPSSA